VVSNFLVALQLALIAAIVVAWEGRGIGAAAWTVVAAGAAIGAWALTANRLGNFNVRPEPRSGGQLVTTGPYRWIRHPMYAAILVACAGFAAGYAAPWRWIALAALVAVLVAKARIEERKMALAHPDYAAYARRTRRFVPFVW
jgi:protein-S-isoprenylcysteine O-methyltransferase Ste14